MLYDTIYYRIAFYLLQEKIARTGADQLQPMLYSYLHIYYSKEQDMYTFVIGPNYNHNPFAEPFSMNNAMWTNYKKNKNKK